MTAHRSLVAAHSRQPGTQWAFSYRGQPSPSAHRASGYILPCAPRTTQDRPALHFSVLFSLNKQSKYFGNSNRRSHDALRHGSEHRALCGSVGTNFLIQGVSSRKSMPHRLPAPVPERQELIVRTLCPADSVLGPLHTCLKYPRRSFLCFDI